jgi:hypothetical protein
LYFNFFLFSIFYDFLVILVNFNHLNSWNSGGKTLYWAREDGEEKLGSAIKLRP